MKSWDSTKKRVDSITEKICQLSQSSETKTKNLDQDWEDSAAGAKKFGWSKDEDNPRVRIEKNSKDGELVYVRRCKGSRISSETFVLSLCRMSTSTRSSSALWSWTSESDFESDHDVTIVLARSDGSVGLQRFLNKRQLGKVAVTSRLSLNFLTIGAWGKTKQQQKG